MQPASSPARWAALCAGLGLVLGWLPAPIHGPVPGRFDVLYIRGGIAVLGSYAARLGIAAAVGLFWWPGPWFVRGPAVGLPVMLPGGLFLLATPGCGFPWMALDPAAGAGAAAAVAGMARRITGRDRALPP